MCTPARLTTAMVWIRTATGSPFPMGVAGPLPTRRRCGRGAWFRTGTRRGVCSTTSAMWTATGCTISLGTSITAATPAGCSSGQLWSPSPRFPTTPSCSGRRVGRGLPSRGPRQIRTATASMTYWCRAKGTTECPPALSTCSTAAPRAFHTWNSRSTRSPTCNGPRLPRPTFAPARAWASSPAMTVPTTSFRWPRPGTTSGHGWSWKGGPARAASFSSPTCRR